MVLSSTQLHRRLWHLQLCVASVYLVLIDRVQFYLFLPSFAFFFHHPISVSKICPQQEQSNQSDSVSFKEVIVIFRLVYIKLYDNTYTEYNTKN